MRKGIEERKIAKGREKEGAYLMVELAPSVVEIMVCFTEAGAGHSVVQTNFMFISHSQQRWK